MCVEHKVLISHSWCSKVVTRARTILQDRYKDNIFFAEISGRKNVSFRNMGSWIISDQWYNDKRSSPDDEAKRVTEIAAKFIESDIRDNLKGSTDTFPSRVIQKVYSLKIPEFDPPPPCYCSPLFVFEHSPLPPPSSTFDLVRTHSLPLNFCTCEI